MEEMDNFPCPDGSCCAGDILRNPNKNCPVCKGSGTVAQPKNGGM